MNGKGSFFLLSLVLSFSLASAQSKPGYFDKLEVQWEEYQSPVNTVYVIDSLKEPNLTKSSTGVSHASETPDYLSIKEELNKLKRSGMVAHKNDPDSVRIEASFDANPTQNFTPMDNSMAIGKSRHIVSVINANFAIYDLSGTRLQYSTFRQLTGNPTYTGRFFDPRVSYDHENERYLMMILYGNTASESKLLLFVSKTNNPLQGWNKLELDGSPGNSPNWSDFPNLAVSKTHVLITTNLFDGSGTYAETGLWSIEKTGFYAGQQAKFRITTDLKSKKNRRPFTLVPAQDGLRTPQGSGLFFVSSYSKNSELIDVYFFNTQTTEISTFSATVNHYDIAPDALQKNSSVLLDIGDCRITGAFYMDEMIHFVMNVKGNKDNVEVFYGRMDLRNARVAERRINYNEESAYAAIAPLASNDQNKAVVISYMYSGSQDYASFAYVFVDDAMNVYPPKIIAQGKAEMKLLKQSEERWGDYAGACADPYADVPSVWISGAAAASNGTWSNYLANVQADQDTIRFKTEITKVMAYPNPFTQRISVRLELPQNKHILIRLRDEKGSVSKTIHDAVISKGYQVLHFDGLVLAQGLYIVEVYSENKLLYAEKMIVKE